jgi:hypothetical protein
VTLVDANILLYSVDESACHHEAARSWLDAQLSSDRPTGFAWAVLLAFVRVSTNPRLYEEPLSTGEAMDHVEAWLGQPNSVVVVPGLRHAGLLRGLLERLGTAANLTSDAHLAALALEHGMALCSADSDFARFPGLRWENPLERRNQ